MGETGDWGEAAGRVKAAIKSQFGHYATFARLVPMEPTQLSATLKPHRRPEPETLDRFSAVLGWEPSRLRQWYDYELADPPPPPPMRADIPDAFLSDAAVEAYCLNHADPLLREQARRGKEALPPAVFTRMCRRTYRAHYANSVNIWGAALDDREPCDHDTFGPWAREG